MLIGIFGLFSHFLPLYDLDIRPWKYILSNQPQPGTLSQKKKMVMMKNLWNLQYQILLEWLKKDILSVPTLSIPYPSRRFYIKTDWSNNGMGAVLIQEDVSQKARKEEAQEKDDVKCEFEKSVEVMCLRPICFIPVSMVLSIYFISRSMVSPLEKRIHSFVRESVTVKWDMGKFIKYLWG